MFGLKMETDGLSPIVVIKQKELELAERLASAKQTTERAILEARQWATEFRDQAEREGQEQATAFYRTQLEACDAEAEKIGAEGELSARWVAERGSRSLDQAVKYILEIVLPPLSKSRPSLTFSLDSGSPAESKVSKSSRPADPTANDAAHGAGPERGGT